MEVVCLTNWNDSGEDASKKLFQKLEYVIYIPVSVKIYERVKIS